MCSFICLRRLSVSPPLINRDRVLGMGVGIVYEGTWKEKKVAVKRIEIARIGNIEREETALRKCKHENVVKLFHVDSDEDFRYYSLEFCVASLDRRFLGVTDSKRYCGPMPVEIEVFLQLAKGMAHIHKQGFIHRDVKPENVLIWVDSTGKKVLMKWADFGLSKPVNKRGSHSISGLRGTQKWFAPEIYTADERGYYNAANPVRPRGTVKSDVFAEGLVFGYYLLGGKHPYGNESCKIPQNILNATPVNLNGIEQHPMHNIIMDMLNNDHVERISSSDVVDRISKIK